MEISDGQEGLYPRADHREVEKKSTRLRKLLVELTRGNTPNRVGFCALNIF